MFKGIDIEHFHFEIALVTTKVGTATEPKRNFVVVLSGEVGVPFDFEIAQSQS